MEKSNKHGCKAQATLRPIRRRPAADGRHPRQMAMFQASKLVAAAQSMILHKFCHEDSIERPQTVSVSASRRRALLHNAYQESSILAAS